MGKKFLDKLLENIKNPWEFELKSSKLYKRIFLNLTII